jgi:hypothetical protein
MLVSDEWSDARVDRGGVVGVFADWGEGELRVEAELVVVRVELEREPILSWTELGIDPTGLPNVVGGPAADCIRLISSTVFGHPLPSSAFPCSCDAC